MTQKRAITDADVERWMQRRLNRESWRTIAADAHRDRSTVEDRTKAYAARLGIDLPLLKPSMARPRGRPRKPDNPNVQPRRCMTCGETFSSHGPHNRMCNPCRRDPDRTQRFWL